MARNRELYGMTLGIGQGKLLPTVSAVACVIMEKFGDMLASPKYFVKKSLCKIVSDVDRPQTRTNRNWVRFFFVLFFMLKICR